MKTINWRNTSWKTTTIGIIVIIMACYLLLIKAITVTEFCTLIAVGVGLIVAKDAKASSLDKGVADKVNEAVKKGEI